MTDFTYSNYGVLGYQIIANSGTSTIYGNIGSINSVTGSGSINISSQNNIGSGIIPALTNANNDYNILSNYAPDSSNSTNDIGGVTFTPGVINLTNSNVTCTSSITLNGKGAYIFKILNGDFTTNPTSGNITINFTNNAMSTELFWIISGNVNLQSISGNITNLFGTIITQGNIIIGSNSTHTGSLIALNTIKTITLNSNFIKSTSAVRPTEFFRNDYIDVESTLPDSQAIVISASNINGGILINSGFGGTLVNTTNSIGLNAQAESNFTTTTGNLVLQATSGLLNMDGGSGINLGNASTSTPINIGTTANSKVITLGNFTGGTKIDVDTGTGGFNVNTFNGGAISLNATGAPSNLSLQSTANSQDLTIGLSGSFASRIVLTSEGTGSDSIFFNTSAGGLTSNIGGIINLISNSSSSSAITLNSNLNNGGIILASGNQGVAINSYNGGTIAIGTFTPATILIGSAGPNSITIGNSTSTSSLQLSSGTGGISIGNNSNSGEIQIGNINSDKTIIVGNNSTNSRLFNRWGNSGSIKTQKAEINLSDSNTTLTIGQLLIGLITITPTVNRSLTLPTAVDAVAGIPEIQVDDSIDFVVINQSSDANNAFVTLLSGSGGSIIGYSDVPSKSNAIGSYFSSGSSIFRMRFTNVSSGSETYILYRIS